MSQKDLEELLELLRERFEKNPRRHHDLLRLFAREPLGRRGLCYDQVFAYRNGADSYYAARGFGGVLRV